LTASRRTYSAVEAGQDHQPAEVELAKETTWYRDHDPRVASRFTSEVRKTLNLIETFPQIGGQVFGITDPAVRSLPVHGFPYPSSVLRASISTILTVPKAWR